MSKENFLRLLLGAAISMAGCAPVSASFSVSPEAGFDALDDYRGKPESRGHQCLRSCKWSALQAGIRTTAAFTSLAHSARHFSAVRYRGVRLSGSVRDRRTAALQLAPVFILMPQQDLPQCARTSKSSISRYTGCGTVLGLPAASTWPGDVLCATTRSSSGSTVICWPIAPRPVNAPL